MPARFYFFYTILIAEIIEVGILQVVLRLHSSLLTWLFFQSLKKLRNLDLQKSHKCFIFWLSGPHGTSNFDHQSLIRFDLNYTTEHAQSLENV